MRVAGCAAIVGARLQARRDAQRERLPLNVCPSCYLQSSDRPSRPWTWASMRVALTLLRSLHQICPTYQ